MRESVSVCLSVCLSAYVRWYESRTDIAVRRVAPAPHPPARLQMSQEAVPGGCLRVSGGPGGEGGPRVLLSGHVCVFDVCVMWVSVCICTHREGVCAVPWG